MMEDITHPARRSMQPGLLIAPPSDLDASRLKDLRLMERMYEEELARVRAEIHTLRIRLSALALANPGWWSSCGSSGSSQKMACSRSGNPKTPCKESIFGGHGLPGYTFRDSPILRRSSFV